VSFDYLVLIYEECEKYGQQCRCDLNSHCDIEQRNKTGTDKTADRSFWKIVHKEDSHTYFMYSFIATKHHRSHDT